MIAKKKYYNIFSKFEVGRTFYYMRRGICTEKYIIKSIPKMHYYSNGTYSWVVDTEMGERIIYDEYFIPMITGNELNIYYRDEL